MVTVTQTGFIIYIIILQTGASVWMVELTGSGDEGGGGGGAGGGGSRCGICFEICDAIDNVEAGHTRCGHLFHDECLSKWFVAAPKIGKCRHVPCPSCRQSLSGGSRKFAVLSSMAHIATPQEEAGRDVRP